jgi:hypothetical protein
MKRLTATKITKMTRAAKGKRKYERDSEVRQLFFMITDTGHTSFVLYTRLPGKPYSSRLALGPGLSLKDAREEARAWLKLIEGGHDPRDIRDRNAEKVQEQRANTFGAIVADYIKLKVPSLARPKFITDTLQNEFVRDTVINGVKVKGLGSKPIQDLTWQHLLTRINAKKLGDPERGIKPARTMARHMLAMVKAVLNWAVEEESYGLDRSVAAAKKPKKVVGEEPARERVLSDPEIRAVWGAANETGYPFGPIVQLLLLSAQRRTEVGEARWSEFAHVMVQETGRT